MYQMKMLSQLGTDRPTNRESYKLLELLEWLTELHNMTWIEFNVPHSRFQRDIDTTPVTDI